MRQIKSKIYWTLWNHWKVKSRNISTGSSSRARTCAWRVSHISTEKVYPRSKPLHCIRTYWNHSGFSIWRATNL